jgi:hypothetical protein
MGIPPPSGVKTPSRVADHSPQFNAGVKNGGAILVTINSVAF